MESSKVVIRQLWGVCGGHEMVMWCCGMFVVANSWLWSPVEWLWWP